LACACTRTTRKDHPSPGQGLTSEDGGLTAELGFGDTSGQSLLPFSIGTTYARQKPTPSSPWHADGGDWTFFDATLPGSPTVPFTVGIETEMVGPSGSSMTFGKGIIVVPDRDAGAGFLQRFGAAFKTSAPPPRTATPLQATPFSIAILGTSMRQRGGVSQTWSATKWFLQDEGLEAEVFFNYDLDGKVGEFAEKDEEYRTDVLAALAVHLRDGPQAERTPGTDPRLTESGPRAGSFANVGSPRATFREWRGGVLVYADAIAGGGQAVLSVAPAQPDAATEVLRVERRLGSIGCADAASWNGCLIAEDLPRQEHVWSSNDPVRYWWLDRLGAPKTPFTGSWGTDRRTITTHPVSPDRKWVALKWLQKLDSGRGQFAAQFVDRATGQVVSTYAQPEKILDVVGWSAGATGVSAIVSVTDPRAHSMRVAGTVFVDPASGKELPRLAPTRSADDASVSRDRARRCEFRADGAELAITQIATRTTRVFPVHPDDRRATKDADCRWAGSRYVIIPTPHVGFVDADTLLMSYPVPRAEKQVYEFSSDLKWVVRHGEGVAVAPMSNN
jgi:hypothetical protein